MALRLQAQVCCLRATPDKLALRMHKCRPKACRRWYAAASHMSKGINVNETEFREQVCLDVQRALDGDVGPGDLTAALLRSACAG